MVEMKEKVRTRDEKKSVKRLCKEGVRFSQGICRKKSLFICVVLYDKFIYLLPESEGNVLALDPDVPKEPVV